MKTIVAVLLILVSVSAAARDSCEAQVPSSLGTALRKAFPKFRPPLVTDNLPEDIQWNAKHGGKGCLGVALADFDGDGKQDVLLGLTALRGDGGLIVVALAREQTWEFHTLSKWSKYRIRLYVSAEKAGTYTRSQALEGPLETGEVDPMRCSHSVAVYGLTESSGVAFCYNGGQWQHVWISD
jgi:hypothetical protein